MQRFILFVIVAVAAITPTFAATPAAPSGLYIDTALSTKNSMTIKWQDNANNEQGFELFINGVSTLYLPANTTQYKVNGLLPNSDYTFQLKAYNGGATVFSSPSNTAGGRTLKEVSSAPGALQAIQICATSVTLFWLDSNNEEYYAIERMTNGSGWSQIDIRAAEEQYFTDKNAPENSLVSYRVKAVNNGGVATSNEISFFTKKNTVPNIPYNLSITDVDTSSITITWYNGIEDAECGTNKIVDTQVWVSEDGAPFKIVSYRGADQYIYKIDSLKKSTPYEIKLRHRGLYGESEYSLSVKDTTLGPPIAPSNLMATEGIDVLSNPYVKLNWKDNSSTEEAFVVESGKSADMLRPVAKVAPNVTFYTHVPTEEGVMWYYRVYGMNKYGNSDFSNVVSAMVDYTKAPNAPYDLRGSIKNGKPMLTWKDDSIREEMVEIERSDDKGATYSKIASVGRNETEFMDTTATAGQTYSYKVRATNPKGQSGYSNAVELTVPTAATSIAQSSTEIINLYPNPTVSNVKVVLTDEMANEGGKISVVDQQNRVISQISLAKGQKEQDFSVSNLKEGVYLIVVETQSTKVSKKVVKQ